MKSSAKSAGAWVYDVQKQIMEVDDNVLQLFGLKEGEYDGSIQSFLQLLHDEDRTHVSDAVRKTLETGASYNVQYRVIEPMTGKERLIQAIGAPVQDADGAIVSVRGTCTEV